MPPPMSLDALQDLYDALREATPGAVWSRGVALSRTAMVVGERADDEEIVLKVTVPLTVMTPTVTFFPDDEDWVCTCSPREQVCEHIVAAMLALRQARESGRSLPQSTERVATVGYRLRRAGDGLELSRFLRLDDGAELPLQTTVAKAAAHAGSGPQVRATRADLEVERALEYQRPGWIPAPRMRALLAALSECDHVELDYTPVGVSGRPVAGMVGRVVDDGSGFQLQLVQDPRVTEVFSNGAVLYEGAIRPIGEVPLPQREVAELRQGRRYRPERAARLITQDLPALRRLVPVEVATERLPTPVHAEAHLCIEVGVEGHEMTVLPTLLYGDPPVARLDGEHMTLFGREVPIRDADDERRLVGSLTRALGLNLGHRERFAGEAAVSFAARLRAWRAGELRGDALDSFHLAAPLTPRIRAVGDTLEVDFVSDDGPAPDGTPARGGRATAETVLSAYRAGAQLVPLLDGGWAPLPADWLAGMGETIEDLLAARDARGRLPDAAVADVARLCDAVDAPLPAQFERLRALVETFDALPEPTFPPDLTAELRTYQLAGVRWLSFLRDARMGALLADDMGLGKTLQALCTLRGRTLVVAPTSVIHNWAAEIARFRPALRAHLYHGPRRAPDPDADVTITSYALLRLDADALAATPWDTVILDEAQAIKNASAQVARAAFRLDGAFRVALTGTPVENRLEELWSIFRFLSPGLLGTLEDFRSRHAGPIAAGDPGAAERLRRRIRPFVLRRLKRDVARELPPRTDIVLRCELDEVERHLYDAIRAATRKDVLERLRQGGSVLEALEALLRLRQASCHAALIPGRSADHSSKLRVLLETLEEVVAEDHKALVFSQWTSLLDLVEPHLRAAGIPFLRLDGSTRDRAGVVEAFQASDGPPVLLISLRAGGTGLNLTAADHVFLLDPWWNPAVEDQAADRAHRIGQDRPVLVHRLVAADTVEERILGLQEQKRRIADAALGGASGAAALTRDDLLALLD